MARNRKSRKRRRPARPAPTPSSPTPSSPTPPASTSGGYARARAKDEAARAALKPLAPGERPGAVTVGAIVAALLAVANLVALAFGWSPGEDTISPGSDFVASIVPAVVLAVVAVGMWRARYWAVLGLQTLLAITIIGAALAMIGAANWWAFLLLLIILAVSGTLFWFLVKAMARIQMPERPGSSSGPGSSAAGR